MKIPIRFLTLATALLLSLDGLAQTTSETLAIKGLNTDVRIVKDAWGISHIYAETEHDLFFAQGFTAARDRLFQLEIWRRQATGTVAEILGERELKRDIGTRLFMFRGDMRAEMDYYHPRGTAIITAFVAGVNAYIDQTERNLDLLSLEFGLLGIKPQKWTPEIVISRHQGLLGNIGRELNIGRAVVKLGPEKVKALSNFHPGEPDIALDPAIDGELLFDDILELYNAFRRGIRFQPEDLTMAAAGGGESAVGLTERDELDDSSKSADQSPPPVMLSLSKHNSREGAIFRQAQDDKSTGLSHNTDPHHLWDDDYESIGSNNWVVRGELTQSGYPIMANDPHRRQSAPSLRYWIHLVGPGWNVIGGGEPVLPGVSIGHNGYGAWGLTVFRTDGEDLYVYDTSPDNPVRYRYKNGWEEMRVITETIRVKDGDPVTVDLKYTRHGPVVYEDRENRKAYAVRAAWMEIGGAPYLASLRMDQAKTWEEFRDACSYSHIPGENMIWADREGNIGWQAVGIAPIRRNWSGLVPVPGDGRYEWDGYLPIKQKPNVYNPKEGFFATANANLVKRDYPHRDAVGWNWSDPFRQHRLEEVLGSGQKHSLMDMARLQTDYLSLPARNIVPLLHELRSESPHVEKARAELLDWDFHLDKASVAAGIYIALERRLQENMAGLMIPEAARPYLSRPSMQKIINWLTAPGPEFGADPLAGRDVFLLRSLTEAVAGLTDRFGTDIDSWHYGRYKHALIRHPLSRAATPDLREKLDVGPVPRGGNSYTLNNTSRGDNQTSGASFRIIVDTSDWDLTLGMNSPGQSGDPASPFYSNLFQRWAKDQFFPVYYSKEKIEAVAKEILVLAPAGE